MTLRTINGGGPKAFFNGAKEGVAPAGDFSRFKDPPTLAQGSGEIGIYARRLSAFASRLSGVSVTEILRQDYSPLLDLTKMSEAAIKNSPPEEIAALRDSINSFLKVFSGGCLSPVIKTGSSDHTQGTGGQVYVIDALKKILEIKHPSEELRKEGTALFASALADKFQ